MRKVTKQAIKAFYSGHNFRSGNTEVTVEQGCRRLYLHRNLIATLDGGRLDITLDRWDTVTTRERLNGVVGVVGGFIYRSKGQTYLHNATRGSEGHLQPIDEGEWVTVYS